MAYNLTSSDSHKIIFQRESTGFAATLFIVVGSIFLLIGIGLNIGMDSWAFPNMLFRILFPAFGLGAIAAGFYAPKQARESTPELITFDHDKGVVKIEMVKDGNEVGYIRYNEIEGFDIYVERNTSSSSSTRSNTTSTTYYYHVFLRKKDGGEWFLTKSGK